MRVRLEDVARAAGVSPKTVSRVLNDEANVRGPTREKVLAAKRSGVREMVLPAQNEAQVLEDVAPALREGLHLHFVRTIPEAVVLAFEQPSTQPADSTEPRTQRHA